MNTTKNSLDKNSLDLSVFNQHPEGYILYPMGPQSESRIKSDGTKEYYSVSGDVLVTDEMGIVRGKYSYITSVGAYGDYEPMNTDATSMTESLDYIVHNISSLSKRARNFILPTIVGSWALGLVSSCTGKENPTEEDVKEFRDTIENTTVKPSYRGNAEDSVQDLYLKGSKIEDYFEGNDGDTIIMNPDGTIDLPEYLAHYSSQYKDLSESVGSYMDKHMGSAQKKKGFPFDEYRFEEGEYALVLKYGDEGGYTLQDKDGTMYHVLSSSAAIESPDGTVVDVRVNKNDDVDEFFTKVNELRENFQ